MPCVLCFYTHTKYYYNFSDCFQVRKSLALALHTELILAKYRTKIPKIVKNTETVYHVRTRSFLLLTAYTYRECTGHDTSSKRNYNRNFQGQPSGWNWLIIVMCSSTDTKSCSPIPTFVWLSILDFIASNFIF